MPTQVRDDIQSILNHSGISSRRLTRLEKISNEMQQLEWKMLRGADAVVRAAPQTGTPKK